MSECAPSCTLRLVNPQLLNGVLMGGLEQCPRREVLSNVAMLKPAAPHLTCNNNGRSVQRVHLTLSGDTQTRHHALHHPRVAADA